MKKYLFALLYRIGIARLAAWSNRRKVTILCYHGVTERLNRDAADPGLQVRRARFAEQLDHLARNYHVIALSEYLSARKSNQKLPDYSVVLTFDDGYRNFLTVAADELSKRNMSAAMFLVTDKVAENGRQSMAWSEGDDIGCLSWDEIRKLTQEQGTEFGSHTCSHLKLTTIPSEDALREMQTSLAAIGKQLAVGPVPLAYPFGDYSPEIAAKAEALGYSCALTTDEGANDEDTSLFTLRRTLIGDDDDEAAFAARVSGLIAWLRRRGA
jgi:peptidoglycan/xylan/chitin deacetylase (PgdA/CDA1 family)